MKDNLNQTEVDIIMPNYNSAPYVSETIDSVINQEFNPKINIIQLKKNKKAGFCRNFAMRISKSEYVAFLDSDDIWDKKKLSKQLEFMIKNKYYFTYTNYLPFKSDHKQSELKEIKPDKYFTFETFIKNTSIATSTMIIKRSLIGNTKFSNTKICEDYFFKCQLLKKNKVAVKFEKGMMFYRISKGSLQSNKLRNLYWMWYINKKFNKLNFFKNFISLLNISISSLKRYGFK